MSDTGDQPNRLAKKEAGHLNIHPLSEATNQQAFDTLFCLLSKCYGPKSGQLVFTHNASNIVTASSSCSRILASLPSDDLPLIRLITTAMQGHVNSYTDAGIFTGLLACALIREGLKLDIHRHLVSSVYEVLLEECRSWLDSESCPGKVKLDLGSTNHLLKLVKCIISSKPGAALTSEDIQHISLQVLTLFINSIGNKDIPNFHTLLMEGRPPSATFIHDGFLISAPDLNNDQIVPAKCRFVTHQGRRVMRTVLVGCSMAGDGPGLEGVEVWGGAGVSRGKVMVARMRQWLDRLGECGVGMLLCQKVIHEDLKLHLKKSGIVAIERLGLKAAQAASRLTGAPILGSLEGWGGEGQFGYVAGVRSLEVEGRRHVEVTAADPERQQGTLVLCCGHEEALDELKVTVDQTQHALQASLRHPAALKGGGCWLTMLANHVQKATQTNLAPWQELMECPPYHIQRISKSFSSSLRQVAASLNQHQEHYVDRDSSHFFSLPKGGAVDKAEVKCGCGEIIHPVSKMELLIPFEELLFGNQSGVGIQIEPLKQKIEVKKKPVQMPRRNFYSRHAMDDEEEEENVIRDVEVLDSFAASKNGLQTAVLAASMVLSVSKVVTDAN